MQIIIIREFTCIIRILLVLEHNKVIWDILNAVHPIISATLDVPKIKFNFFCDMGFTGGSSLYPMLSEMLNIYE